MKKLILLFATIISGITFGQFTVSDSSKNWEKIGSNWASVLYKNNDKAKIVFDDVRSKKVTTFGDMYKTDTQKDIKRVADGIQDANEGVKKSNYEFIFSASGNTLNDLYAIIESHFKNKTKEVITLEFPEGNLYLDFNSKTAFYAVSFGIDSEGQKIFSSPFLLKQVDKLFGKTK